MSNEPNQKPPLPKEHTERLKQSPKANQRLMPIHKQIALGQRPTTPKISNPPKK